MKKLLRLLLITTLALIIMNALKNFNLLGEHYDINKKRSLMIDSNYNRNMNLFEKNKPSIFCMILTQEENLSTRAKAIYDTWASQCDNFRFVLTVTNYSIINLTHDFSNYILTPAGLEEDTYEKLTDKVYLTIQHLYKEHGKVKFDWYLKADDDTFIFVDNLRKFLSDKNPYMPITFGFNFKMDDANDNLIYNSGGAGYLLSKHAFEKLGSALVEDYSFCPNSGVEDKDVGKCLSLLNVKALNTIDEHGRERFHPANLYYHFFGGVFKYVYDYGLNQVKHGYECCSEETISFHYESDGEIRYLHELYEKFKMNSSAFSKNNREQNFKDIINEMINYYVDE